MQKIYTFETTVKLTGTTSIMAASEAEALKIAQELAVDGTGAWSPDQAPSDTEFGLAHEYALDKADEGYRAQGEENANAYDMMKDWTEADHDTFNNAQNH